MSDIRATILQLAAAAGPAKSICPSEVARALTPDWRPLMSRIRAEAVALTREGRLHILRHGKPVEDLDALRGVIRLRIAGQPSGVGHPPREGVDQAPATDA